MGSLELCRLLDRRLLQHQHMDDLVEYDHNWSDLVAVMVVRLDWLHDCGVFHLLDWAHRRNLPHRVSRRRALFVRNLGFSMACV